MQGILLGGVTTSTSEAESDAVAVNQAAPEAATSSEQTASANPAAPERVAAPAAVAPEHLPACNATALADSSTALETATVSQGGDG
jgi:hypothetical protein